MTYRTRPPGAPTAADWVYVPDHRGGLKKVIPASFYSSTDKPLVAPTTTGHRTQFLKLSHSPTIATPSAGRVILDELRRKGSVVDCVKINMNEESSSFRIAAIRWRGRNESRLVFHEDFSALDLDRLCNSPPFTVSGLYDVIMSIVDRLHRQILRHDRAGFPGTYTERDLDAPLV